MRHLATELLASKTDQVGRRDHGDVGKSEYENMMIWQGI